MKNYFVREFLYNTLPMKGGTQHTTSSYCILKSQNYRQAIVVFIFFSDKQNNN